jgi:hypothetical protein
VDSATTSYRDGGLLCGIDYSYVVRAFKNNVESDASNTVTTGAHACPPNTPANLRVVNTTSGSITLAWDDVSGETGYRIYRWGIRDGSWGFYALANVSANVGAYTDLDLACGIDQYYTLNG